VKRVALLLGLLLALPAVAHGAAWKGAGKIATSTNEFLPLGATVDRSGRAVFAWHGTSPDDGVFARSRPRGGPLRERQLLSRAYVDDSEVAGNAGGTVVLAWSEGEDQGHLRSREMVALRTPGAGFGPPQTLFSGNPGQAICDDAAAIDASGTAMVVFGVATPSDPGGCRLYAAVRPAGSALFDEPVRLGEPGAIAPQVGFDARGNALIAWSGVLPPTVGVVRYLPAAGGFQPPQQVGIEGRDVAAPGSGPLLLRVSRTGAAIVAFPSRGRETPDKRVAAAIGDTEHGFGPAALLSGPATLANTEQRRFDAAAGADGTLAVAWRATFGKDRRIQVARVGPGADSITSLDTNTLSKTHAGEVAVAIAGDGRVTVAWTRYANHRRWSVVETATGAPSRHFRKPQRVSKPSVMNATLPDVATSSRGERFITWVQGTPDDSAVQWTHAPTRTGPFVKARRLLRGPGSEAARLYRGARGAMLATVRQRIGDGRSWTLCTFGEH
jgi:hypothetical protein